VNHPPLRRRAFLQATSAVGVGLLLPTRARASSTSTMALSSSATSGLIELSSRPQNYESTLDAFSTRITPTDRFYIRGHFDTPVIDLATWRLSVDGLVERPASLSLAELEKLPQHDVEAVLQCAGNGRALMQPRVPGVQWTKGAMGNARWRGPRLKDVLLLARPRTSATTLQMEGVDRPVVAMTPRFIRGVPLSKAMHDDTIVALQMNGKPLSRAHGAPARLVMPGWVADGWTKWLGSLTLLDAEPKGFFYETAYRYPTTPGEPGQPVPPERMKPMHELTVKSVIASPSTTTLVSPGRVLVRGVAFSGGGRKIARVDVGVDAGPWVKAKIVDDGGRYGFSVFQVDVQLAPGRHVLRSRATDTAGAAQPEVAAWNPSGYLHNAIDVVSVEVTA
jgi:DMSO/TMAO reductase YedYZ molybdopterin-dependent catalytic subunit